MKLYRSLRLLVVIASAAPTAIVAVAIARLRGGFDVATIVTLCVGLAVAVGLAELVAHSVTRPIRDCAVGALDIARGRFGRQVPIPARNEIGDLAYTFNYMSRELASYDTENRRLIAALERGYLDTIRSLAAAVDAKDPDTRGHSERVAALAAEIGREMKLPPEEQKALEYGGFLHDIGKIGIPDQILTKRGSLVPGEMELVRAHPRIGAEIVAGVEFLRGALPASRNHHERWDGGGYPDRLAGEDIPLVARIINVADTWDACTSNRPYQEAIPAETVVSILDGLRGSQIDPAVHDALLAVLRRRRAAADAPQEQPARRAAT